MEETPIAGCDVGDVNTVDASRVEELSVEDLRPAE
jgi:hypothetical protein